MAKSEVKVSIISEGGDKAAKDIAKVDDAADKASKGGLSALTDKVPGLNSALGKIPGGSELASGGISALGAASVAGGAALVAFAAKGVSAFEDTTLAVGKFRDATGTTSEEASRFVEVFGDLGIGAEAGQAAIGKMEKALGSNSEAFKKYGVEVVRAKDGTIDAQGTFLAAVDALNKIRDPAEKAAAGAAIFGKGWQSMAEIIGNGSASLKDSLDSVQLSKVFTDKDIKSGRDVRDAFDSIKDAGEGLLLTVGKSLAPAISALAPSLAKIIDAAGPLSTALGDAFASAVEEITPLIDLVAELATEIGNLGNTSIAPGLNVSIGDFNDKLGEALGTASGIGPAKDALESLNSVDLEGGINLSLQSEADRQRAATAEGERWTAMAAAYTSKTQGAAAAVKDAAANQKDMEAATRGANRAIADQTAKFDALKASVSDDQAWLDLESTFDDVRAKGAAAMDAARDHTADAEAKMRDYQSSVNTAKSNVIDLGHQIGLSIPTVKSMLLQINDGAIDTVEGRLRVLTRNRTISLDIISRGGAGYGGRTGDPQAQGATGAIVTRPTMALIGEAGPEAVIPLNKTAGSSPLPSGGGGGMTVHINMPVGSNGADVVRAIQKYERQNGPGWRS
jgi:hypothetical protein